MDLGAAGLKEQPFPTHGKPLAVISYAAEQAGLDMLRQTCEHPTGLSLLQGPSLSGKSTLIRTYIESLSDECAAAVIDGKGLNTTNLLMSVLRQFGYDLELSSANELLGLVRVFALQQAASSKAPLLIIENAHELNPSAIRALLELAGLQVRRASALKIILVSDRSLKSLVSGEAMEDFAERLLHDFHLRPMGSTETRQYLYAKLRAAGSDYPEFIFPIEICDVLWKASNGWPGILDRVALLALARADCLPVRQEAVEHPTLPMGTWDEAEVNAVQQQEISKPKPPQLIVTNNGSLISDLTMDKPRLLIGRSDHNDIAIGSRFVSRHHALLVRHGAATFLMDLNSTNGTFVNSMRVSNHVLIHQDLITFGHHRIKFYDPYARSRGTLDGSEFADTAIMKTLQDMRNLLARENTALMPAANSEELPTVLT